MLKVYISILLLFWAEINAGTAIGQDHSDTADTISLANQAEAVSPFNYVEVQSDHFTFRGRMDISTAHSLIRELEVFRAAMLDIYESDLTSDPVIEIFYLTDSDVYEAIAPWENTSALYLPSLLGPKVFVNAAFFKNDPEELKRSLFHEYMHHLNTYSLGYNIPLWLNEGLAEYYATFELTADGQYIVGQKQDDYFFALAEDGWTPILTLFNALYDYPVPRGILGNGVRRSQAFFYAQSWLITHYLMTTNNMEKMREFVGQLDPQLDSEIAFEKIFGVDYITFQETLEAYALTQNNDFNVVTPSRPLATPILKERALTARNYNTDMYGLLAYFSLTGPEADQINALREQLQKQPQSAEYFRATALQALKSDNTDCALSDISAALKLNPNNAKLQKTHAIISFMAWQAGDQSTDKNMQASLRSAIKSNPSLSDLKIMLVSTYYRTPDKLPSDITQMIDTLLAENIAVRNPAQAVMLVSFLQESHQFHDIDKILDIAEIWQEHRHDRRAAEDTRGRVERYKARKGLN